MVSEIHVDDPAIAAQLLKESQGHAVTSATNHSVDSSRATSRTSQLTSRTHSALSAAAEGLIFRNYFMKNMR